MKRCFKYPQSELETTVYTEDYIKRLSVAKEGPAYYATTLSILNNLLSMLSPSAFCNSGWKSSPSVISLGVFV